MGSYHTIWSGCSFVSSPERQLTASSSIPSLGIRLTAFFRNGKMDKLPQLRTGILSAIAHARAGTTQNFAMLDRLACGLLLVPASAAKNQTGWPRIPTTWATAATVE